jgi:hypothetical protein
VAELLWLPPEAKLLDDVFFKPVVIKNGRSIYMGGSAWVRFTIDTDREELSSRIVEHFAATAWRQRRTEYMNPQIATSFERGWEVHGGGVIGDHASSREPFRQWHGEWEDARGNVLTYDLGGSGRQLTGVASYVPRSVVEAVLRKMGRMSSSFTGRSWHRRCLDDRAGIEALAGEPPAARARPA